MKMTPYMTIRNGNDYHQGHHSIEDSVILEKPENMRTVFVKNALSPKNNF